MIVSNLLAAHAALQEINSIDRKHRVPITNCNLLGYVKGQKVKAALPGPPHCLTGDSCSALPKVVFTDELFPGSTRLPEPTVPPPFMGLPLAGDVW